MNGQDTLKKLLIMLGEKEKIMQICYDKSDEGE